jgi:hypothetical protein
MFVPVWAIEVVITMFTLGCLITAVDDSNPGVGLWAALGIIVLAFL